MPQSNPSWMWHVETPEELSLISDMNALNRTWFLEVSVTLLCIIEALHFILGFAVCWKEAVYGGVERGFF